LAARFVVEASAGLRLACVAVVVLVATASLGAAEPKPSWYRRLVHGTDDRQRIDLTGPRFLPWYQRSLVGIEVGPTGAQFCNSDPTDTRYCARLDGREIVRRCAAAQAEYVVIWARDGDYAYYDSKLLPKAPGLGDRDPLRDAVAEAKLQGLPVIAYCVVQQGGHCLAAHPEFEMRDARGNRIGRFCYNSGYLEPMKQILDEQLAYGIDGFHIDMLDMGFGPPYGCWCDACRQQFQAEYGKPMPAGVNWDEDWDRMLEFRYRSSERFEKALYAHVKSPNPQASVDFNYHGNPPFSWEVGQRPVQHAGNSDFVTGETGMWGFSALTVGLNAEFYRAADPGQPVQVAISRDARIYHNQTVRPLADLRWELFTLLAHGSFVTVVDKLGFDGWSDPLCYGRLWAAFAEARAKRECFAGRPVQDVGIYFSSRTRDWVGRENPGECYQAFLGAHKAMVYEHIPWGVLLDENATDEALRRFPAVLLPNVGILGEPEIARLQAYVEKGGNLIVTGLSGCYDRMGRPQEHSSLEALIGARLVRRLDSLDNWVRGAALAPSDRNLGVQPRPLAAVPPAERLPGILPWWLFLVKGPAVVYEPTSATPVGELLKPFRTTRQTEGKEGTSWPLNAEAPVGPAVLVNRVGQGTVLTFAVPPDCATAGEHHIPEARRLLATAVRFLRPTPVLRIEAPVTVEAVVTGDRIDDRSVVRVHLIAYQAPPQTMPPANRPYILPALLEDKPMYRATLVWNVTQTRSDRSGTTTKPLRLRKATALSPSALLRRDGDRVEVTVDDIHEVITLQY